MKKDIKLDIELDNKTNYVDGGDLLYNKIEENNTTTQLENSLENKPENKLEEQSKNKPKKQSINGCDLCVIIIFVTISVGSLTCYFVFLSPIEIKKANDCKNAISDILTKVNVTSCDGRYVDCQYVANNRNITCRVEYDEPLTCIFPDNSVYIYTSKDNKHCTSYEDNTTDNECKSSMMVFFVFSVWLLGGFCCACNIGIISDMIKGYST